MLRGICCFEVTTVGPCCVCQVRDFAVKLNNYITSSVVYFKSQWSEIRSNAATLVGQCQTGS